MGYQETAGTPGLCSWYECNPEGLSTRSWRGFSSPSGEGPTDCPANQLWRGTGMGEELHAAAGAGPWVRARVPGAGCWGCSECLHRITESQNHRITESQNSRGWKGPLWVI